MKKTMKRLYKLKNRLYLEAKYLAEYGFDIGQPIRYEVDHVSKTVVIESVVENKKRVASTTQRTGTVVPVIDIKASEIKEFFALHQRFVVEFKKGKIVFTVDEAVEEQNMLQHVVSLEQYREQKKTRYSVDLSAFAKVVNCDQTTIFDLFHNVEDTSFSSHDRMVGKAIRMLSLFSGGGTMDKAFLDEGYEIIFANDRYEKKALKDYHIQTYQHNIGEHILMKDVMELTKDEIPETDFLCAGIPCVTFSALNTKTNFRNSKSDLHPIVEKTIDILKWSKAKAFLFENVEKFLTVKNGKILDRLKERLADFGIVTRIIDARELGSAQKRKRAFIFGIQGGEPTIDVPALHEVRTVKDAFMGVESAPQQDEFFIPTAKILERMRFVPQGGNIQDVPIELRAPKKKFNNYCQRLSESGQAPTITHVQDDVFFHPTLDRYLTVREVARLFSLPDDFTFIGSLTAKFEMLKNAVDYRVSTFLAKTIKKQLIPFLV